MSRIGAGNGASVQRLMRLVHKMSHIRLGPCAHIRSPPLLFRTRAQYHFRDGLPSAQYKNPTLEKMPPSILQFMRHRRGGGALQPNNFFHFTWPRLHGSALRFYCRDFTLPSQSYLTSFCTPTIPHALRFPSFDTVEMTNGICCCNCCEQFDFSSPRWIVCLGHACIFVYIKLDQFF